MKKVFKLDFLGRDLIVETGELAKAIRKDYTDMKIDDTKLNHYTNIENEIADVFIVLTCICNKLKHLPRQILLNLKYLS